jgi:hypothetical protein
MRRALRKLLPEDRPSVEKRSCKWWGNNERPKYQNAGVSLAAFFFESIFVVGGAAYCRSGWGVLSFVTSFYGNGGTKFPNKASAEQCLGYTRVARLLNEH